MTMKGLSEAQGKLIYVKNLKSKILCQTLFKLFFVQQYKCSRGKRMTLQKMITYENEMLKLISQDKRIDVLGVF